MSANHNHADEGGSHAGHDHTAGANAKSLTIALGLTGSFLIAELVGAYWFNSLALLSDAAHMFTDAAALAIALAAIKIGQRAADKQRTYGYRRFEILAAAFNAILLFVVAGYVLYEGVLRFFKPEAVGSVGMLIVASIGLLVNLIAMRVLVGGKDASLNIKGAYLEVWADMLGSLGVIVAAVAIYFTNWSWIDPILLRDTTQILLQGVPRGMDLDAIRAAIGAVPGVAGVHDLHVWSVAGDDASLTAHIAIASGLDQTTVRKAVAGLLEAQFKIHHSTLQTETESCGDEEALHA
jgi:cobalt-zinc-cadmium efflux system protein